MSQGEIHAAPHMWCTVMIRTLCHPCSDDGWHRRHQQLTVLWSENDVTITSITRCQSCPGRCLLRGLWQQRNCSSAKSIKHAQVLKADVFMLQCVVFRLSLLPASQGHSCRFHCCSPPLRCAAEGQSGWDQTLHAGPRSRAGWWRVWMAYRTPNRSELR